MKEIWKDVYGYEGYYKISNKGNVLSFIYNKNGKLLKPVIQDYYKVNLRGRIFPVHRLVAMAFIPNPKNKKEVNHIDGNKHNNVFNNLEWVTRSGNTTHAIKTGLQRPIIYTDKIRKNLSKSKIGSKNPNCKLMDSEVLFIINNKDKFKALELSEMFDISIWYVRDLWRTKRRNRIYL